MKALSISFFTLAMALLPAWALEPDTEAGEIRNPPSLEELEEISETSNAQSAEGFDASPPAPDSPDPVTPAPEPNPPGVPSPDAERAGVTTQPGLVPRVEENGLPEYPFNPAFWECRLPGGAFTVGVADIVTVSLHEYRLADEAVVYEVMLATRSPVIARFYHWEPVPPPDRGASSPLAEGQRALDRIRSAVATGGHLRNRPQAPNGGLPVKRAEDVTLAPTVEFRLDTRQDVEALYQNAHTAWKSGEGGYFELEQE